MTIYESGLPPQAQAIIDAQPRVEGNPYVFPGRGKGAYNISQSKRPFDVKLVTQMDAAQLPPMQPWVLHDLRRTARTLLSRAGVRSEIAERVLGHRKRGVEGIYDRHEYAEEKRIALAKLATLIENIVEPPKDNVRLLKRRSKNEAR